jgi:hypothetical protein
MIMSENRYCDDLAMRKLIMKLLDRQVFYRALQSRDARFDGLVSVGVKTTGIYCRPICPGRTAKLRIAISMPLLQLHKLRASGPASVAGQRLLLTQHPGEGRRALSEFGSWRDLTQPQIDSRSGPRQSPLARDGQRGPGDRHGRQVPPRHLLF